LGVKRLEREAGYSKVIGALHQGLKFDHSWL